MDAQMSLAKFVALDPGNQQRSWENSNSISVESSALYGTGVIKRMDLVSCW